MVKVIKNNFLISTREVYLMKKTWHVLLLFLLCAAASTITHTAWANEGNLIVENCHLDGIRAKVRCGTLELPEDYDKSDGKVININFAILPAIDNTKNKTPLMFLAGGPGQAAVELAAHIRSGFTEIRKTRDIILVDQRGTGLSHPLQCDESQQAKIYSITPEDFDEKEITTCIETLQKTNDLSQFTSENAVRDFDEVRKALGHDQIHIYGGSYGTRAALVYMRLFPQSIKSAVLDSVGPIEVPIGTFGLSAERSFNLLLEHCVQDIDCNGAYPNLANEYIAVVNRLSQGIVSFPINHPRLGTKTPFVLSKRKFINVLFKQLYNMETRTMVPLVIHEAFKQNYQPLIGLISTSDGNMNMYVGLTFNIVCNEDMPKITPEMFVKDSENSFDGNNSHIAWKTACPLWPKYTVDNDFYQSVVADIPTLILSGNLDPVTPPSNGDKSAATLPNSHHIISNSSAHIVASTTCGVAMVNDFLNNLDPKKVDQSCLLDIPKQSFMTGLNGSI